MERKMEMEEEMGYDSSEESCEKVRKIEDDEVWQAFWCGCDDKFS